MRMSQPNLAPTLRPPHTPCAGVFDAEKNDVRARSMLRVALRKELSTTSMRLPQTQKASAGVHSFTRDPGTGRCSALTWIAQHTQQHL